ncbi:MAG: phosphate ABC transporter substrate-binding protein [Clostridia bacterium]|nr:phosphate ABC transporter substrate-binding protein [Clostridia bacterium]
MKGEKIIKKEKVTAVILTATTLCGAFSFASCGGEKREVRLAGSTSVAPLMGDLAEAYMALHGEVEIVISEGGSAVGIANAKEGKGDFGMASKAVSEEGVTSVKICDDGIVVVTNKDNELTDVTGVQLYDFFAYGTAIGNITLPIARNESSGTRDAFEELVKNAAGKKLKEETSRASNTKVFDGTGAVLVEVQTNKAGLGYISLGSYDGSVKKLSFNGVEATAENIKNGDYQLSRPFVLLYNSQNGLSEEAQAFLDFVLSDEGQAIIEESGYITL